MKKIFLPILIFGLSACINNVEDVRGTVQNDVSFSTEIQPILEQRCVSCHGSGFANNNTDLSSYQSIFAGTGNVYGEQLVVPNSPNSSGLVEVIEPNPTSGVSRMPPGGPFLSGDEINKIRAWISEGAQNN